MKSKVIDVACGPGWLSHFLAKLGYWVYGIDLSPDLIEIAQKRVACEPFAPYDDLPLRAHFKVHDIEKEPMDTGDIFEAAFFESALHHFYDPIAVIKNISVNLREEGLLCVWEGGAPEPGSEDFKSNINIMQKYHTLERPYTRHQIIELLEICGYPYYEFYSQINGLYNQESQDDMEQLHEAMASGKNWNIFVASRKKDFFERKARRPAQGVNGNAGKTFSFKGEKEHEHKISGPIQRILRFLKPAKIKTDK